MALTRDLWLVLRARDEASRIVRSFGTTVGGTATSVSKNISQFDRTIANISTRLDQFARTSMLVGTVMAGLGAAGVAFIKSAVDVAAEYDRQVRRTITQIDNVAISLEDIAEVGRRVAREVEIPFEQMQETLFFIFSSIDVNITQAEELLRGFAKEAVAGQTSIEAAARSNIAVLNALGLTTNDLGRIQDVMFQVVRKGIITYEELANVVGRALPATSRAGQSFETLGAMIAFMTRNGLSAAMAATSAARALESFAHPKTIGRLTEMGIKVRDAKGEFMPLIDVMAQLNKKMSEMAAPERAKFLQELFTGAGGTIQARRFWDAAFKNFGQFEEMIGHMGNSTGVFESAYKTMSGSVAAQSELLRNKWMLIKEALGRAVLPDFLKFIKMLGQVLDWFEKLPPGTKTIISQFILWGSVISIVIGVIVVLIGAIAFFVASIMAAGTALLVVLGVITVVTAALLGIGAAFFLAWQHSEGFRETIRSIGDALSQAWDIVVNTAKDVKSSFDSSLRPSLEKLWDVTENKVIPAAQSFIQIWKDEVIPKLKEAGRIVSDLAKNGFEYIGGVIDTLVIPAIEKLSAWWDKNSDSIRPFLGAAGQLVKWLLILAAVIVASPFMVLVTIIGAVIVHITTLITIGKFLVNTFKSIGSAIGDFFVSLWKKAGEAITKIGDFFKNVWNDITSTVTRAVAAVGNAIKSGLEFVYNNTWVPFWNVFGGFFKEIWGLLGDIVKIGVVLIGEIIKDWIMPLLNLFRDIWNGVVGYLRDAWNEISGVVSQKATEVSNVVSEKWNQLKQTVSDIWNGIKMAIGAALLILYATIIKPVVDKIRDIWNNYLKGLFDSTVSGYKRVAGIIGDKIQEIKNFFSGAGSWLLDAGKNILQGLIDGITNKVKDLRKKLKDITDEIPNWKGPRAVDVRLLAPVGTSIMGGLIKGIKSQVPVLRRELQGITSQIGQVNMPSFTTQAGGQLATVPTESKTFNQYFTINTQEIDPRTQAAELGWLLEGRM